ncbi:MAG: hypothetical protein ACLT2T_09910 [Bilophila wadsworthia]
MAGRGTWQAGADKCVQCGMRAVCPQHIAIRDELVRVHAALGTGSSHRQLIRLDKAIDPIIPYAERWSLLRPHTKEYMKLGKQVWMSPLCLGMSFGDPEG